MHIEQPPTPISKYQRRRVLSAFCAPYLAPLAPSRSTATGRRPAQWQPLHRPRCTALVSEGERFMNERERDNIELGESLTHELNGSMSELDKALAVAEEAAAAAGVDPNIVKNEVRALTELGGKEEELSWDDRMTALLEDIGEFPEYYVNAVGAVSGVALASLVASAALSAISAVPALSSTFEMIGLVYVFWFGNNYVLSPTRRAALAADVRAMLRDARTAPKSLLDATLSRTRPELNANDLEEEDDNLETTNDKTSPP